MISAIDTSGTGSVCRSLQDAALEFAQAAVACDAAFGEEAPRVTVVEPAPQRQVGPVMKYFRHHAADDCFSGDCGGTGEVPMLVHGQVGLAQATLFNERLQRRAQEFAHQHLADQNLPDVQRSAYTPVLGMRS